MSKVTIREAVESDAMRIKPRVGDIIELHLLGDYEGVEAGIIAGINGGVVSYTAEDQDGEIICIFGIGLWPDGSGCPWLVGSSQMYVHKITVGLRSKRMFRDFLRKYKVLSNLVWVGNHEAIAWLKWLGFHLVKLHKINDSYFWQFMAVEGVDLSTCGDFECANQ